MSPDLVASLVEKVDAGRLVADVARLAEGERHSLYSPERHAHTVDYISGVLGECGLATRQHVYDLGSRRGINIVGHKKGSSSQGLLPSWFPLTTIRCRDLREPMTMPAGLLPSWNAPESCRRPG